MGKGEEGAGGGTPSLQGETLPLSRAGPVSPRLRGLCFPPGHLSPQGGPVVCPDRFSPSPLLWMSLSSGRLDTHRDPALGTRPHRRLPHHSQTALWF